MSANPQRERWLASVAQRLGPHFTGANARLPENIRITCGWPSKSGTARKRRVLGECWDPSRSADQHFEIFISPTLADEVEVAAVLVHELIHTAVGIPAGHNHRFWVVARSLGLGGKPSATTATEAFEQMIAPVLEKVGEYPHSALKPGRIDKPDGTRQKKCECARCGYVARTTRKWLTDMGPPHCPAHGKMAVIDAV